jgi:hypothetical protein
VRAIGFITIIVAVLAILIAITLVVLAFIGVRAALDEERNRRLKKSAPESAPRQGGVPLFNAKRRE